jgi:hypothetical protein
MKKKASLRELMGKKEVVTLDDIREILNENLPNLPLDDVGRYRLVKALQQRFGKNFRSLPGVDNFVKDFDKRRMIADLTRRKKEDA